MRIMKHKTIPEELEEMVHFGPTSSPPIQRSPLWSACLCNHSSYFPKYVKNYVTQK